MKHSFIRFILVGLINTCVGLGMMYLLLDGAHLGYWISSFIGNSIGAVVSYFLNRRFTFRSHSSILKSGFRFVLAILGCYFISYKVSRALSIFLLGQFAITGHWLDDVALLIGSGLYTISNYFAQKKFVFPQQSAESKA
jgi:putative flippase GtrA